MAKNNEIVIRVVLEQSEDSPATAGGFKVVGERSASQELRLALMRRHQATGGADKDFEDYYQQQMERIIGVVEKDPKGK